MKEGEKERERLLIALMDAMTSHKRRVCFPRARRLFYIPRFRVKIDNAPERLFIRTSFSDIRNLLSFSDQGGTRRRRRFLENIQIDDFLVPFIPIFLLLSLF